MRKWIIPASHVDTYHRVEQLFFTCPIRHLSYCIVIETVYTRVKFWQFWHCPYWHPSYCTNIALTRVYDATCRTSPILVLRVPSVTGVTLDFFWWYTCYNLSRVKLRKFSTYKCPHWQVSHCISFFVHISMLTYVDNGPFYGSPVQVTYVVI